MNIASKNASKFEINQNKTIGLFFGPRLSGFPVKKFCLNLGSCVIYILINSYNKTEKCKEETLPFP